MCNFSTDGRKRARVKQAVKFFSPSYILPKVPKHSYIIKSLRVALREKIDSSSKRKLHLEKAIFFQKSFVQHPTPFCRIIIPNSN